MNWKKIGIAAGAFGMAYLLFKGSSKPKMIDVVNTLTRASAFDKRNLSDIKNVVVHHTAGSPNDTPEAIAAYHVNSRGFRGIGYHIVINPQGTIYLCNYLDSISSHIGGKNLSSIGVCCIGNFENYDVPAPQYKALLSVLAWLKKEFKGIRIVPHKLWSSTACPGDYMMARLFPSGPDSPSAIGAIIDKNSLKETTRCSDGSYSTAERSAPGLFGIEELPVVPKPGDVVFLDIEASARMSPDIAYVLNQENQDTIKRGIIDLYYVGDFDQLNGTSIVNIAAIAVFAPNDDNRHLAYQLINNLRYYYSNMANLLNYE